MKRALVYLGLVVLALFYLLPVYVLVVTSLKELREVSLETMWRLPRTLTLESFVRAWAGAPGTGTRGLAQNFWNSVRTSTVESMTPSFSGCRNTSNRSPGSIPHSRRAAAGITTCPRSPTVTAP